MNTSQPRRSARIASRSATPMVTITIQTFPKEKSVASLPRNVVRPSVPVKTSQTPVKTRHSRRLALRQRPNYYEPEEWEVEDPIYPSNTECRISKDLPFSEYMELLKDIDRMKMAMGRAENDPTSDGRNVGVFDTLHWCRMSAYLIPMFPKFRVTTRAKIREFEEKIASGKHTLSDYQRQALLEEIERNKEALANAHRSPWFVAAAEA